MWAGHHVVTWLHGASNWELGASQSQTAPPNLMQLCSGLESIGKANQGMGRCLNSMGCTLSSGKARGGRDGWGVSVETHLDTTPLHAVEDILPYPQDTTMP